MKRIVFAALCAWASIVSAQDTNFSTVIECDFNAPEHGIRDLTLLQGAAPMFQVRPMQDTTRIEADAFTTVEFVMAPTATGTYFVVTNAYLATNKAYWIQLGTIGTNSCPTNSNTPRPWFYSVTFSRNGGIYWAGNGRAYIEKATFTGTNGLVWQEWAAGAAKDDLAREWIAFLSNEVDNIEVGDVAYGITNGSAYRGDWGASVSNKVASMPDVPPPQSFKVWKDEATNYIAASFLGTRTTNASFSALLSSIMVPENTGAAIEIGPSRISANSYAPFYIDSPIVVSSTVGFTLRGRGNYGTTIAPAENYDGEMFLFTNMTGICRFEDIRFQAGVSGTSMNTNPCINAVNVAEIGIRNCEFDRFKGTSLRHRNATMQSSWNKISGTYFVCRNTNGYPVLDIGAEATTAMWDYLISENHFYTLSTNTILKIYGNSARFFTFTGNKLGASDAVIVNGIVVEGGYGHTFVGNGFQSAYGTSRLISFLPAASNNFMSTIAGNAFGGSYGTNIHITADAHGVNVYGNSMPSGKVQMDGANTGGYYLNLAAVTTNALTNGSASATFGTVTGTTTVVGRELWVIDQEIETPVLAIRYAPTVEGWYVAGREGFQDAMANWDAAYGWGDHATEGYITNAQTGVTLGLASGTTVATATETNQPVTLAQLENALSFGMDYYMTTNLAGVAWIPTNTTGIASTDAPTDVRWMNFGVTGVNHYVASLLLSSDTFDGDLAGPASVHIYAYTPSGAPTRSLSVKPELYYTYDLASPILTNGDFSAVAKPVVVGSTNALEYTITWPTVAPTGNYYVVARLKTTAVANATNIVLGVGGEFASHIQMQSQTTVALGTRGATQSIVRVNGSNYVATYDSVSRSFSNDLGQISPVPIYGETALGTGTNVAISGATYIYTASPSNSYTLTAPTSSILRYSYALTVISTNSCTMGANLFLRGTWTPAGTNILVLWPSGTTSWWVGATAK